MGFSAKQVRALHRGVASDKIRTRTLNGREFSYIEGWHAIAEANRIFGFDGWDRETLDTRCVLGRETRGTFLAIYLAKVRLTIRADGATIIREGHGSGEARSSSAGEAHEIAIKAAETDATKRALATFGKPFGLAFYGNRNPQGAPRTIEAARQEPAVQNVAPATDATQAAENLAVGEKPGPVTQLSQPASIPGRIDKSLLQFGMPRRERDKHHLAFVATQPCLLCSRVPSDAHHLRFAQTRAIGRKVGDQFTVPLCRIHHRQVHECRDEEAWWTDLEVNAMNIAKDLWEESRAKRAALIRNMPGAIDPINNGSGKASSS